MGKILYYIATIILISTGCVVSKKKYEASVTKQMRLQKELKDLKNKFDKNISDFEVMKNQLHRSNAALSDSINNAYVYCKKLESDKEKLNKTITKTKELYSSQKKNYNVTSQRLNDLKNQIKKLQLELASIKYALKLSEERYGKLESSLKANEDNYNRLVAKFNNKSKEAKAFETKFNASNQELIIYKAKIEEISKALIALRKQMLSAKSSKKVIDPNKNKYIDIIAKQLGHY